MFRISAEDLENADLVTVQISNIDHVLLGVLGIFRERFAGYLVLLLRPSFRESERGQRGANGHR